MAIADRRLTLEEFLALPEEKLALAVVVDPRDRAVILVRLGGSPTTLRGDDHIDLNPVLPDFELTVHDLFATLQLD